MLFSSLADQFFLAISWLGSLVVLVPCTVILAFFLYLCGKRREAQLLSFGLALSVVIVHPLKLMIKRPRPEIDTLLIPMPTSWSFPSAHTAQAAAFFFVLAFLAARNLPQPAAGLTIAASMLATLAVGYSRVYLQVHYVSDVLAGALVGGGAVLASAAIIHILYR